MTYVGISLPLFDASFHREVKGRQTPGFLALTVEDWDQLVQPALGLAVYVSHRAVREVIRGVRSHKRFHQLQGTRSQHRSLYLLVGHQRCNGEAGIVLDVIIGIESERKQPFGCLKRERKDDKVLRISLIGIQN